MPRSVKKRVYKRKRSSVATKAFVKRQLSKTQELKSWDSSGSHTIDGTTEIALSNSLIGQGVIEGTGGDERIGRKVVIKSLHLKMAFTHNVAANADSYGNTFTAIVLDKEFNGTAPTVDQIFSQPGSYGGFMQYRNRDYLDRFKILKVWTHTWGTSGGIAGARTGSTKLEDFHLKNCNLPIEYTDNTGALASMRGNAIFMVSGSAGYLMDDVVTCQHTRRETWTDGGASATTTGKSGGVSWGQIVQQAGFGALASYAMASALID